MKFKFILQEDNFNNASIIQNYISKEIFNKKGANPSGNGELARRLWANIIYKKEEKESKRKMRQKLKNMINTLRDNEDGYILHHINGKHNDDNPKNLCLMKKTLHNTITAKVTKEAIQYCLNKINQNNDIKYLNKTELQDIIVGLIRNRGDINNYTNEQKIIYKALGGALADWEKQNKTSKLVKDITDKYHDKEASKPNIGERKCVYITDIKDPECLYRINILLNKKNIEAYIPEDENKIINDIAQAIPIDADNNVKKESIIMRSDRRERIGNDLSEFQKWVDYDMKKYGRISDITKGKIKKAGLSIVKDQYGDYEVIADRPIKEGCKGRKLKEAKFRYTLKKGRDLYDAIEGGDYEEILTVLWDCYEELLEKHLIDEDDFERYVREELYSVLDDAHEGYATEEDVDFELGEFYDLCDNIGVWCNF